MSSDEMYWKFFVSFSMKTSRYETITSNSFFGASLFNLIFKSHDINFLFSANHRSTGENRIRLKHASPIQRNTKLALFRITFALHFIIYCLMFLDTIHVF